MILTARGDIAQGTVGHVLMLNGSNALTEAYRVCTEKITWYRITNKQTNLIPNLRIVYNLSSQQLF
jgi:hypothetical protein